MDARKRFTIAGVLAALLVAGAMAMAANLGLLGLAGADDRIGQLDAGEVRDLVVPPSTTTSTTRPTTSTSTTEAPAPTTVAGPVTPAPTVAAIPPTPPVTLDDDGTADQGSGDVPEVGDDSGSNSGSSNSGSDDTEDDDAHEGDDDDD